ncbi:MAG: DUF1566 domain-containing protein [Nitrospiraceae bacterium]|nr:DUF1566 domain-containing protein [Nitrospiraceae bacterium]
MILNNTRLTDTAFFFLSLFVFPSFASADTVQLPETGQTISYYAGDDGDIRSGVPWPSPRFSSGGTGCRIDNLTGLTWAQNGNLPGVQNTWEQALAYIVTLNGSGGVCGHTDWRLPNVNELATLININEPNSATWLNAAQGFNNVQAAIYWTSTTDADLTSRAWTVKMSEGDISEYNKTSSNIYMIPVRGTTSGPAPVPATGQTVSYTTTGGEDGDLRMGVPLPTTRFQVNGDGTATDELTGLVWLQEANVMPTRDPGWDADGTTNDGAVTWQHALDYVAKLNAENYLGHNDWRLSNRNELRSLINYESYSTTYFASLVTGYGFSNIKPNLYWSSTTRANSTGDVWTLNIWGDTIWPAGKTVPRYVWPVRSIRGIQVSPRSFNYGGVYEGDTKVQTFTVYNDGNADVAISSLSYGLAAYAALDDHCSGALLRPLETCTFDLAFKPLNTGGNGSLFILSDDTNRPSLEVLLGGDILLTCSLQRDQGVQITNGHCVPDPNNCDTIQSAYNSATAADTIRVRMITFSAPNNFNLGKTITLEGGYDCSFAASTYYSTIGPLTITSGEVTIANIVIQ